MHIRPYVRSDLEAFWRFWDTEFGEKPAELRVKEFLQVLEGNPYSKKKNDYWVLEESGKTVAYCGLMPYEYYIRGKRHNIFIYHDSMVDPKRRRQGLGYELVKRMTAKIQEPSIAVWMNLPNSRLFDKCGWVSVRDMRARLLIYDSTPFWRDRVHSAARVGPGGLNAVLSIIRKVMELRRTKVGQGVYRVEEIDVFDGRVEMLFEQEKSKYKYIGCRDQKTLNWKYAYMKPPHFVKLICLERETVKGYVVFYISELGRGIRKGSVVDFLCADMDPSIFENLIEGAVRQLKEEKVAYIEILSSNGSYNKLLKGFGFVRGMDMKHALKVMHFDALEPLEFLCAGENWFFTYGDGDRIFWNSNSPQGR